MEPKFSYFSEKIVIGLEAKFISPLSPQANSLQVIPRLWDTFNRRMKEIPEIVGNTCYGLIEEPINKKPSDEISYLACVEATFADVIPSGMQTQILPAGHYAVFTHKGSLENLPQTYRHIYSEWSPTFQGQLRKGPHLEVYDDRFKPESSSSEMDICVPIL